MLKAQDECYTEMASLALRCFEDMVCSSGFGLGLDYEGLGIGLACFEGLTLRLGLASKVLANYIPCFNKLWVQLPVCTNA